jgi:hypothetical protein
MHEHRDHARHGGGRRRRRRGGCRTTAHIAGASPCTPCGISCGPAVRSHAGC